MTAASDISTIWAIGSVIKVVVPMLSNTSFPVVSTRGLLQSLMVWKISTLLWIWTNNSIHGLSYTILKHFFLLSTKRINPHPNWSGWEDTNPSQSASHPMWQGSKQQNVLWILIQSYWLKRWWNTWRSLLIPSACMQNLNGHLPSLVWKNWSKIMRTNWNVQNNGRESLKRKISAWKPSGKAA